MLCSRYRSLKLLLNFYGGGKTCLAIPGKRRQILSVGLWMEAAGSSAIQQGSALTPDLVPWNRLDLTRFDLFEATSYLFLPCQFSIRVDDGVEAIDQT